MRQLACKLTLGASDGQTMAAIDQCVPVCRTNQRKQTKTKTGSVPVRLRTTQEAVNSIYYVAS